MPLYLDTYLHIFVWILSMKDENDNKIELCQALGSEHCGGVVLSFLKKELVAKGQP
jgi:hypothetical protein